MIQALPRRNPPSSCPSRCIPVAWELGQVYGHNAGSANYSTASVEKGHLVYGWVEYSIKHLAVAR